MRITPCLWFDGEAEDAAKFYVGIFPNSRITAISRYGEAGRGDPQAQQCGWLKDRKKADRVMAAVMEMKKMDLAALERAYAG